MISILFQNMGAQNGYKNPKMLLISPKIHPLCGWTRNTNNGSNRFVLISDLLNNNYEAIRIAYYKYHRIILDRFVSNPNQSRIDLVSLLEEIRDAKRRSTNNYLFDLFFGSKSKEITSILIDAESDLKFQAYNVLRETDSANLSEYESLQE